MADCPSTDFQPDAPLAAPRLADEPALIRRASRDPQAFAALYERHYQPIARYLYRRTGDVHATEDLTSETFLTALRTIGRFRWRGVSLRHWLFRIATNAANRWASQRRTLRVRPRAAESDERLTAIPATDTPADARADVALEFECVQAALLTLSVEHQAALTLHYVEGLGISDVAAIVGCREGTVKSRLARARDELRTRLGETR